MGLLVTMALRSTSKSQGQISDEILAARVAQGDVAALEALYDRHAAMVLGIALRVIGERPAAENVLQETFWRAWQSIATYQPGQGSFSGWLFRMARQLAMENHTDNGLHSQAITETARR
jgi:RNA polymerase sigma-70 factor (ECF subfamily)